ncbi:MAG: DNA-3-methyladenine glycosylase 2 family protein [Actinobacteria bacterium]|nr:DNA-3-methyladenine glycosylase 2 family protein [Actinomycetota bacterium]
MTERRRAPRQELVEAAAELGRRDPRLGAFIAEAGLPTMASRRRRPSDDHFAALAQSIIYQQLAGRAAAAIHGRFAALFDGTPSPGAVLTLPVETLRSAGLSGAKAASIRDLAEKVEEGAVKLDRLSRLSDDEIVRELTLVRGIGPWTAQMFLIFRLGRLDVWPVDDLGVRKGYARLFGLPAAPTPKELEQLGDRFRPYRSVLAWYCWRAAETVIPAA